MESCTVITISIGPGQRVFADLDQNQSPRKAGARNVAVASRSGEATELDRPPVSEGDHRYTMDTSNEFGRSFEPNRQPAVHRFSTETRATDKQLTASSGGPAAAESSTQQHLG